MKKSLLIALNTINSQFYDTIAQDFSDSREFNWQGWDRLIPLLQKLSTEKKVLSVLDVGCGNGRFASFLAEKLPYVSLSYTGIDSNEKLLNIAKIKLASINATVTLQQRDIVIDLLENKFLTDQNNFDLIVAFGVVHHIPSIELRVLFFKSIKNHLEVNGITAITLWNFMEIARMQKKQSAFTDPKINSDELEPNDFLLSWNRGSRAYRYCHYSDQHEQQELINSSGLTLFEKYQADGKEGVGNTYLVLK